MTPREQAEAFYREYGWPGEWSAHASENIAARATLIAEVQSRAAFEASLLARDEERRRAANTVETWWAFDHVERMRCAQEIRDGKGKVPRR